MRTHYFSKMWLSVLCLPAFLSAELINLENDIETSTCYDSDSSYSSSKKDRNEAVFASYRNDSDITIPGGGKVLFNVKNANKGDGIRYKDGTFTIEEEGFYLINYGLASIGEAGMVGEAFGFNLVRIRHGHQEILDSVLTNSSSAVILSLRKHDKIAVVSQEFLVNLTAGNLPPRTTSLTDTAHISFLKIDQKGCR